MGCDDASIEVHRQNGVDSAPKRDLISGYPVLKRFDKTAIRLDPLHHNDGVVMKRLLIAATAAAALGLTGCSAGGDGGGGGDDALKIAWISPDATTSARWETQDLPAFKLKVEELAPGTEIIASTASTDEEMLQQAEAAVTQGAQVIVINPITADGSLPVVDLAQRENIPVVAYEGLIEGAQLDGYITFNNEKVGELQAQYIVDHVDPEQQSPS